MRASWSEPIVFVGIGKGYRWHIAGVANRGRQHIALNTVKRLSVVFFASRLNVVDGGGKPSARCHMPMVCIYVLMST
jgi:hypothetical protein